ncbi:MAG: hypothetical protein QF878_07460 [SAR202 cluster bacterium]|jgi:hypothetical protein|nr:hypothetical protein [SAR202 cluster bacterium]
MIDADGTFQAFRASESVFTQTDPFVPNLAVLHSCGSITALDNRNSFARDVVLANDVRLRLR